MIRELSFQSHDDGWTLDHVKFGGLSLFVGPSGVGKSRILNAIRLIQECALSRRNPPHAAWNILLEVNGHQVRWSAETRRIRSDKHNPMQLADGDIGTDSAIEFIRERIEVDGEGVANRADGVANVGESEIAGLNASYPLLLLFHQNERLASTRDAFQRFRFLDSIETITHGGRYSRRGRTGWTALSKSKMPWDALRRAWLPLDLRLLLMRQQYPARFEAMVGAYRDIFPNVESIEVAWEDSGESAQEDRVVLSIKEEGIGEYPAHQLSRGMARALYFLTSLTLAPADAVIVIDEFENSFGPNCIDAVAELLQATETGPQLILTSHHPYVINAIRPESWQLVTRSAKRIRVVRALDIPTLASSSRLDTFTRLLNTPEYAEGIR